MKKLVATLACWLVWLSPAMSQGVSVEVVLDQAYFLPHEALMVKVRITNFSGQPLEFGKDDDWLSFAVEGSKSFVVPRLAPVAVRGAFTLDSSQVATRTVDLAPCFDLSRPNHYTVRATVNLPQWQRMVTSDKKGFDILSGAKLWEQDFGVPQGVVQAGGFPVVRKYALFQTIHGKQLKLYLRLSDVAENKVFRIFAIGPMVSFGKPEPQMDKFGNLHVLYQTGARSFNYSIVSPEGLLIARETHDYTGSRPVLRAESEGRITVTGGIRRPSADDLPPPTTTVSSNDAEPKTR